MRVVPRAARIPRASARQKWKTIRYALDDTGKTIRLCVILMTMSVAGTVPFLIILLARGYLG